MICLPCARAADWIPAQPLYDHAPPGFIAEQRIEGHTLCVGAGSCACQHRVRAANLQLSGTQVKPDAAATEKLTEEERRDG